MDKTRRKLLRSLVTAPLAALVYQITGCRSDCSSPNVDISAGPASRCNFRRVRLTIDRDGSSGSRTLLAFYSESDTSAVLVRLISDSGHIAFELPPGQAGEVREGTVRAEVSRSQALHVYVIARASGEPGRPATHIRVESSYPTQMIEVWVEPVRGLWRQINGPREPDLGICAVHAGLVRREQQARVLVFSPPRRRNQDGSFEVRNGEFVWNLPYLHDVEIKTIDLGTFQSSDASMQASGLNPINLFCTGHVHLPDGRFLTAGGHISTHSIADANAAWIHLFSLTPSGSSWTRLSNQMRRHRWYPTVTVLPDERLLITSGSSQALVGDGIHSHLDHSAFGFYAHLQNNYEIFDSRAMAFSALEPELPRLVEFDRPDDDKPLGTYPAVFVLPGGANFPNGVVFLQEANRGWLYAYLPSERAPLVRARRQYSMSATTGSRSFPHYGSHVLLPFKEGDARIKVLSLGGQNETATNHKRLIDNLPATNTAEIFDYEPSRPLDSQSGWRRVQNLQRRRVLCDATLLPDGQVLITGGCGSGWSNNNLEQDSVFEAELFDPATESFRLMAAAQFDRRYHATALLLPDGTVLKMGSTGGFEDGLAPDGRSWIRPHFNGERFFAPYLWRGPRPQILSLSGPDSEDTIGYARPLRITVSTDEPGNLIVRVIKLGAPTHGLDMDQRCVGLAIQSESPRSSEGQRDLIVQTPSTPAMAPPGEYMLFVLDQFEVPSLGHFVRFRNI